MCIEQDVSPHKVSSYLCSDPFLALNTRLTSTVPAQMNSVTSLVNARKDEDRCASPTR